MTELIIQVFILVLIMLNIAIFVAWKERFRGKEQLIGKAIDKVSSLFNSKIVLEVEQRNAGPWYLEVYTQDDDYPIWISNNNIRSVHPDAEHRKLIIKQFNGEDMVIENVHKYELFSAKELGN